MTQVATDHWQPLFDGLERDRLLEVAREIAAAIAGPAIPAVSTLGGGFAGIALALGYADQVLPGHGFQDDAGRRLEEAYLLLNQPGHGASLYSGWAGIGFAIQHLSQMFELEVEEADDDPLDEFDEQLLGLLREPVREDAEYDLIRGWVGLGVYALERLPRLIARDCLEQIIERLADLAERRAEGLAWHHPVGLLPDWQRPNYPDGWYNMGLAHGMPGIVGLLGEASAAGVATLRCGTLLSELISWMLSQRLPSGAGSYFPAILSNQLTGGASRSAWCYGDPGIAATLLVAARATGTKEWEEIAKELMRDVATRSDEQHGVRDAMLCHGAAGLGHMFNRFYQATGDVIYADQARQWMRTALDYRDEAKGVGGFLSYHPQVSSGTGVGMVAAGNPWRSDAGILTGSAGVALALLAACSDVEPRWDRMLLLSQPSRMRLL